MFGLFLMINPSILRPKQEPVLENRPLPGVNSLEVGKRLYLRLCEVCHGTSGQGDGPVASILTPQPANLTVHVPHYSDRVLFQYVYNGIPGTRMLPLSGTLSEEEIWHLVNYIQTMAAPPRQPGEGEEK
jgi:mono/diheme cytochrome c family protein